MRLTTARYYTPSGRSIQAVGIEPDIVAKQIKIEEVDQPKRRRESDLRGALKNDNGDKDAEPEKPVVRRDYQLERALDLLRGLSMFSKEGKTTSG